MIEESSSASEDEREGPKYSWQSSTVVEEKKRIDSSQERVLELENSDEDEFEIGRIPTSPAKKKRLDSFTPPSSDHSDDEANGDDEFEDEEEQKKAELVKRHPIRLTIRNSSCTIGDSGLSPIVSSSTMFLPVGKDRRRSTNRKKVIEESMSGFTSSTTASDTEDDKPYPRSASKSKRRRARIRKRSKIDPSPPPDPVEPPELQVMVSDSELWFINERNTKHKQETAASFLNGAGEGEAEKNGDTIPTTIQHDSANNHVIGEGTGSDKDEDTRVHVVITDVKAHNYSVIIKECYQPAGFFKNSS